MMRALMTALGAAAILSLSACGGDTCESVQNEIQEIGREIRKDPLNGADQETVEKLEELQARLMKLECYGG